MRDTGHKLADRREALLPDHLPLQRLQFLEHAALFGHLRVKRRARLVEAGEHLGERELQLLEFAVGIGCGSIGLKSPEAMRCAAPSRCATDLVRRRENTRTMTSQPLNPSARIVELRVQSKNARCSATDIGIPTETSHGPLATTASL